VLAVMGGADVFDDASPGNVAANDFAFLMRKQSAIAFVSQHGEKRFYVRDFAAKGVGYADGIRGVGFTGLRTLWGARRYR